MLRTSTVGNEGEYETRTLKETGLLCGGTPARIITSMKQAFSIRKLVQTERTRRATAGAVVVMLPVVSPSARAPFGKSGVNQ